MKKKKIRRAIFYSVGLALVAAGLYGYSEYNRKVKDLQNVTPDVKIGAVELIAAFEKDEANGNTLYLDKIIEVKGILRELEKDSKGFYSLVLGIENEMSAVRCSMDIAHKLDVEKIQEGAMVTVKGACTGFTSGELLGSDVFMNRCVIVK